MLPGVQPSRPRPQQQSQAPTYAYQQRRAAHEASQATNSQSASFAASNQRPRPQVEAMPPFGPANSPATFFTPVYSSAMRHPVFFTQNLKKVPFPIPQGTSQGWSPVASGYIREDVKTEPNGKTKL